jgi:hypothetical protein
MEIALAHISAIFFISDAHREQTSELGGDCYVKSCRLFRRSHESMLQIPCLDTLCDRFAEAVQRAFAPTAPAGHLLAQ